MTVHEAPWGNTREWYTPASLFDRLGVRFDLDPASPMTGPVPWVPAERFYSPSENGLVMPWSGQHVWLNPPYGPPGVRFVDRMLFYRDGLMLLPSRTETRAYQRCLVAADAVCLLRDRLWFVRPDGSTGRSSFGSTLFAFGNWATGVLRNADLGWFR